ncbi:MAG: hypothetical protein V7719_04360 [Psychroserpens sp.]|uniref:hypothetical protein n=1 Tax=Psychroserpens sp. TaxID=2020870 RepID=UPI00300370AA
MNIYASKMLYILLAATLVISCQPKQDKTEHNDLKESHFEYTLSVEEVDLKNAPSLQSFAHGVDGDNWLLFAGRTNSKDSLNGGLHNLTANYANTSFTPPSYNDRIFVYNAKNDKRHELPLSTFKLMLQQDFPENYAAYKGFESVFQNSNALVKQNGEYLYVIGGYGPIDFKAPKNGYETYNQVAKIHVKSLIHLVKREFEKVDAEKFLSFGRDSLLISTGGELQVMGSENTPTFYLAGGHNFAKGQKYVDAVYPFTIKDSLHQLTIKLQTPISDVVDPTLPIADDLSTFRRRDGPIVPTIYKSPVNNDINQGLAFYTGVFMPGSDSNLQAWNDAVYVHPSFANKEGKLFTIDTEYNQNNYNVYSCPNFVVYDSTSDISYTFLIGGIGDGKFAKDGNLSGFTNTAVRIETNISEFPLRSSHHLIKSDYLFNQSANNKPPFYGAEAILFINENLNPVLASDGTKTELLDMTSFDNSDTTIGHIYGGIEAFRSNPGTYGKTYSRASNKIWKVVLKKK